jgi:hypothetical protein
MLLLLLITDTAEFGSIMEQDAHPNAETSGSVRLDLDERCTTDARCGAKRKKIWGKKLVIDWSAVAMLVPGSNAKTVSGKMAKIITRHQLTTARAGQWTAGRTDENAVPAHGDRNWE